MIPKVEASGAGVMWWKSRKQNPTVPILYGPSEQCSGVHLGPSAQMEIGQMRTRTSSRTLRTRNTKYSTNMVRPNIRLIFQRQAAMEMMTKRSMRKSSTMAQNRPLELTVTDFPSCNTVYMSHGTGRLEPERTGGFLSVYLMSEEC